MINCEQAKTIPIVSYLEKNGFMRVKEQGDNVWFCSPFRNEKTASFKVSTSLNLWVDYGNNNEGGDIINLVMKLKKLSNKDALQELSTYWAPTSCCTFSFHKQQTISPKDEDIRIGALTNFKLLTYLTKERHVNINVAKNECKEIHFYSEEKHLYGIGFPNRSGGYEVRAAFDNYKRCVGKKDISHIKQDSPRSECCVFEGFMDYLSYLSCKACSSHSDGFARRYDYIVLNSTSMAQQARDALTAYGKAYLFLDNDESGREASRIIMSGNPSYLDMSVKFLPFIDFNDWWVKQATL